ncbi:hypothetical protein V8G54_002984 [Vigna mungo]|uniref:Uncharacterized protein n=1 Tax=Vigna mungo TaxID=3915 RepID=A0AAQ3PC57_VIGMU
MNPGITATASSISFLLPITEVCPQLTPLLLLPMHFSLTAGVSQSLSPARCSGGGESTASVTAAGGISPEPLLMEEMSPELLRFRKSSVLSVEEMTESELVDANSKSSRSSRSSSSIAQRCRN